MRELLAHPTALKLYVMRTGSVHMSGNIHFNKPSLGGMKKNPPFFHWSFQNF